MINLLLHEVRVRRGAILGWTIGLGLFTLIYLSFYPALPPEMRELDVESVEIYQAMGVQSIATFEGYLLSTVYNFLPLLAGAFGVFLGVGALVGEEDEGTLELLAALPLSRAQLLLAKATGLAITAFIVLLLIALAVIGVFAAIQSQIDTPISAGDLFWVTINHWLIAFVFMSLGLFLGAYLPNRRAALAVSTAFLVLSFFGNNLVGLVPDLEPYRPVFPFYYFTRIAEMLTGEVPWGDVLALLLMAAGFLVLAVLSFQRRNLTVGAWPWQRPKAV